MTQHAGILAARESGKTQGAYYAELVQQQFQEVIDEYLLAAIKHGVMRTPVWPGMSTMDKLAVLGEEFGEVCRALTYDGSLEGDLKAELLQVATMALAWRASL